MVLAGEGRVPGRGEVLVERDVSSVGSEVVGVV